MWIWWVCVILVLVWCCFGGFDFDLVVCGCDVFGFGFSVLWFVEFWVYVLVLLPVVVLVSNCDVSFVVG